MLRFALGSLILVLPALVAFAVPETTVLVNARLDPDESAADFDNLAIIHESPEAGAPAWSIEPGHDPYRKVEWMIRLREGLPKEWETVVFKITYHDKGAGVIQPRLLGDDRDNGSYAEPIRQLSFTRLNTGVDRHAYFEFSVPIVNWESSTHVHLRIAGLQYLRSVEATRDISDDTWRQAAEGVPERVTPMVTLQRPIALTCTVGIPDVGNPPSLETALANIREYAPLAKLLGFTSVECFVRWDLIETQPGVFDFSHYDAIVDAIRRHDLKWYPLLVVTSGYSLPPWFFESEENVPLVCLEHGEPCHVPSIWNPANEKHVAKAINAFAAHYEPTGILEAVRLGPSGNFGEAQFPAGAGSALGYQGRPMHAHIGWWCGDPMAAESFRRFVATRYPTLDALNAAWDVSYASYTEVRPQLPETYRTKQGRLDMTEWYTDSMTRWCDRWATIARRAMPDTPVYQSSGGWGFREAGTDFSAQAQSMARIDGGIRLTNETDSFEQNVYATRLAATAARLSGIGLGYEPAGYHSARGVVARFFTVATTNATNLYTRHSVLFTDPYAVQLWLDNLRVLDQRANPVVDVALFYPETSNQLEDGAFRHLYGWGFNPRAAEIRRRVDVDYLDERLIRAGFLDRYAALVFCWGNVVPQDVLQCVDRWIRAGGAAIFPTYPRGDYTTPDGDASIFRAWERGDTGLGSMSRFMGDMEPITLYGDFVEQCLREVSRLNPWTRAVLDLEHPPQVFFSVLEDGRLVTLNYGEQPATIQADGALVDSLGPYAITIRGLQ